MVVVINGNVLVIGITVTNVHQTFSNDVMTPMDIEENNIIY